MKICKPVISECPGTSVCLCNSDTPVVVFDSNRDCVVCGGGRDFEVKSSFFNENGDSHTCIHTDISGCSQEDHGWTQYIKNTKFKGNESQYRRADFSGYCDDSVTIYGQYHRMILSEVIDYCQESCQLWPFFSLKRDSCVCTTRCEYPMETDIYDTYEYLIKTAPEVLEREEFLERWGANDPNIACYKDLAHSERVPCDWIRALKHFARGASYRVGDCTNLAPGVGEGVNSQIPCSGHGFLSGGTCACDYPEEFDLKSTGIGLTFELPNLRQTAYRGKGCEFMCPGYNLKNMDTVCSGHGRCESDGRCACEQGYVGFKCHLKCEVETEALTCNGHGVCNVYNQAIRPDIYDQLKALECIDEDITLSVDTVVLQGESLYYMYVEEYVTMVEIHRISVTDTVTFDGVVNNASYLVSTSSSQEEDPDIEICRMGRLINI